MIPARGACDDDSDNAAPPFYLFYPVTGDCDTIFYRRHAAGELAGRAEHLQLAIEQVNLPLRRQPFWL